MVSRYRRHFNVFMAKSFSELHSHINAARYKVHVGGCNCSKLDSLRKEPDQWVVVPEISNAASKAVFLFRPSSSSSMDESELELKEHIFGKHLNTNETQEDDTVRKKPLSFKISCASCLLLQNKPNGFLCIHSNNQRLLNMVRDKCRSHSKYLSKIQPLHDDHAHYVCTLSHESLRALFQTTIKKRPRKNFEDNSIMYKRSIVACNQIFSQMKRQNIPVSMLSEHSHSRQQKQHQNDTSTITQNIEKIITISLGHHLESLLRILKNDNVKDSYWLVLVYDDRECNKKPCWTLDLPGGKRHLGETSLQGALREAKEEISFDMNELDFKKWINHDSDGNIIQHEEKKASGNVYFMATPPSPDMDTDLCKAFEQRLNVRGNSSKHASSLQRALPQNNRWAR